MDRKRIVLLLAIALLVGAFSSGVLVTLVKASSPMKPVEMSSEITDKWEYCAVSKAAFSGPSHAGVYWITYFQGSGLRVVNVEDNATSNAAIAKAFARVGDEGWEMTGQGTLEVRGSKLDAWYFKRPKHDK